MGSGSLPRAGAVVLGSRGCRAGRSARPGHANGPATRTRSARRPMSTLPRRLPRLVPLAGVLAALGAVLVALAPVPVAAQAAQAQGAKEVDGTAQNKWVPATVKIQPGQSVTFKVASGATHPVGSGTSPTAKDNRFDTSKCQLAQMTKVGDSCTVKFPKAGTYPFFCEVHFALGMTGT